MNTMTNGQMTMGHNNKRPLPEGWRWVMLEECLSSLETGSRPKGGAIGIEEGVPSISAEHMTKNGTFDFSTLRYVPFEFFKEMTRGQIRPGDVLVVKDGATTGKVALVTEQFPFVRAVINEHVFLCRPNTLLVESHWLFFWLWGTEGQISIRSNFQGAAVGGINQSFANTVFVPLAPLPEQKRIAAILNEQMAAVEKARAATEAQLEAAKVLARCVSPHRLRQPRSTEVAEEEIGGGVRNHNGPVTTGVLL
jgi:type I restriction enzyme S subunit